MELPDSTPSVILVEGESDKAALVALAQQRGDNLDRLAIAVMGGATSIGRFLSEAAVERVRVAGLCDAGEEGYISAALQTAGLGNVRTRTDLETLGFFVCEPDLEAELIRAVGVDAVLSIIATQGEDPRRFRSLQGQPEWRGRPVDEQLRRWFGSGSGRKIRYAGLLAGTLSPADVPRPLSRVLEHALAV